MKRIVLAGLALQLMVPVVPARGGSIPKEHDVAFIGDRGTGKPGAGNWFTRRQQKIRGKNLAKTYWGRRKAIDHPLVAVWSDRLSKAILEHSDWQGEPLEFKVVPDKQVNAMAIMGGNSIMFSGLIVHARTEAEVAAVIAHEIGHIAEAHTGKALTRLGYANALSLSIPWGGPLRAALQPTAHLAIERKFGRKQEQRADELAVQYLWKAGFPPESQELFLERRMTVEGKQLPAFLTMLARTHPLSANRLRHLREYRARWAQHWPPQGQRRVESPEFPVVQAWLKEHPPKELKQERKNRGKGKEERK